jgi:predicted TIM-barrel fold metal-dependent hydrolase
MDGLIDCDVHPTVVGGLPVLLPYMPSAWRKLFERYPNALLDGGTIAGRGIHFRTAGGRRPRDDATPPSGGPAGSDPQFLATHHFDRHGVEVGILLPLQGATVDRWTEVEEAAVFVSAFNDYMAEHWLAKDPRFRLAMVVSPHDPQRAAAEIRRFGPTPGVVSIWLPAIDKLFGAGYFHPIYEAAEEQGLAILTHVTGGEADYHGTPQFAGGTPPHRATRYVLNMQIAMSNMVDLIFEGIPERYPRLKFVFTEFAWTWVPALIWRMDQTWKSARHAHPWMRRAPSDYVRENVRFTSQPALDVPKQEWEDHILEAMFAERTLLFSSDYPHWDADEPRSILKHIAPELRRRIVRESAIETFGDRLALREAVS